MKCSGKVLVLAALVLAGCGQQKDLQQASGALNNIVSGSDVTAANEYSKHTVFLQMSGANGGGICTGSIYDSQTILTAAHCLVGAEQALVVFANNVKTGVKREQVRIVDVATVHPKFAMPRRQQNEAAETDPAATPTIPRVPTVDEVVEALNNAGNVDYDIAMVHFQGGLPAGYAPVTLAKNPAVVANGTKMHMIGYGLSRVASKMAVVNGQAKFIPVPDQTTPGQLRETEVAIDRYDVKTQMIFTDGRSTSVCSGDSGGPAFVTDTAGQVIQVGIAEAVATAYCNSVAMHTAVFPFLDWIEKTAAELAEKANPASKALMF